MVSSSRGGSGVVLGPGGQHHAVLGAAFTAAATRAVATSIGSTRPWPGPVLDGAAGGAGGGQQVHGLGHALGRVGEAALGVDVDGHVDRPHQRGHVVDQLVAGHLPVPAAERHGMAAAGGGQGLEAQLHEDGGRPDVPGVGDHEGPQACSWRKRALVSVSMTGPYRPGVTRVVRTVPSGCYTSCPDRTVRVLHDAPGVRAQRLVRARSTRCRSRSMASHTSTKRVESGAGPSRSRSGARKSGMTFASHAAPGRSARRRDGQRHVRARRSASRGDGEREAERRQPGVGQVHRQRGRAPAPSPGAGRCRPRRAAARPPRTAASAEHRRACRPGTRRRPAPGRSRRPSSNWSRWPNQPQIGWRSVGLQVAADVEEGRRARAAVEVLVRAADGEVGARPRQRRPAPSRPSGTGPTAPARRRRARPR